jgi:phosphoribosylanthranilate isomerase
MNFLEPGPPVRIKICGITAQEDASVAIDAGADALGFNFFRGSRRFISLEENRSWIASLAGQAFRVAVVVNASMEELTALRESGCFDAVQFHGTESPELCEAIGFPTWIRAVRVQGEHSLAQALQFKTVNLLLDAWSDASYGGTGRNLDWTSAARFAATQPSKRVILAGGLNPGNVGNAIRAVRPHAVDVASGVESSPGRKDIRRIRDFVQAVRESLCSDPIPALEGALGSGNTTATNRRTSDA